MKHQKSPRKPALLFTLALSALMLLLAPAIYGQAPTRVVGTVSGTNGTTITVKNDAGQAYQVDVPATAVLKRIAPGQRTLAGAETIKFSDLSSGDRVLVRMDPNAPAGTLQAQEVIAIKESDLARKQEQEREAWQTNGVGGLVKSIDPAGGVILLTSGAGQTKKTITIHTTKDTILKRYAPASVRYDEATQAPITDIHPGDQLRARGDKNADGTELTAAEVVSGSFRNISGTITSLDPAKSTLVVKDLATKKQVTIHISPESQMRKLPERMAQFLAMRLKGGAAAGFAGRNGGQRAGEGRPMGMGQGGEGGPAGGAMDLQQLLSRAPQIKLTDLNKGDAVMLVSTQSASDVTAITLLAGVEPLLQSSEASQNLLSNWSMNTSGGADVAAAQ